MSLLSSLESLLTLEATMELVMDLCHLLTNKKQLQLLQRIRETYWMQRKKLKARAANKMGYRDLVMSTERISLNIVENAIYNEMTKGDLKKAWERLERRWNLKTREDKVKVYTKFLNYKLENTRQRPMDWITFMKKKRAELMNTGHIMDDETFITHLLNSLPQSEYKGAILVIKDKLRKGTVEIPEIEQLLEDKYQAMKHAKG